jgi:hypothetical protein
MQDDLNLTGFYEIFPKIQFTDLSHANIDFKVVNSNKLFAISIGDPSVRTTGINLRLFFY